jgi:hypothetical protein
MSNDAQRVSAIFRRWRLAYWALIGAFYLTAALNLLHVRGGFLTSYLADLTVPPLLYVISRRLVPNRRRWFVPLMQWAGRTPERAALFFFLASSGTEVSQVFWPRGFFAGRYDPWDIVAYGVGLSICYGFDKAAAVHGRPADEMRSSVQQPRAADARRLEP